MELSVHVEDDQPVIFSWQNVDVFVQAIQAAQAQAAAGAGRSVASGQSAPDTAIAAATSALDYRGGRKIAAHDHGR